MTLKQPSIKTRSPSWPQDFSRRSPTGSVEGCSNPRHASTNWCPRCSKNLWHGSILGKIYAKPRQWSGTNQGIDKEGERVGLVPRVWWGTECCEEESHQHSCAGVLWPRERTSAASRQQQRRSWGSNSSGWQANWVCIEGAHPSGAEMGTNWEGDTVTGVCVWAYRPVYMWASALCIRSTIIPPRLTDPQHFHYCTDSNPGTGADDAFVLKRGVWRNATRPSHSRPAIAASARHFQICFLP